ncbi:hypothetical protein C8Q74DRAFT_1302650 [Fomes fomentarius]|nr:hypothetical protein C8Q74DRAFT_1302650 [Fomes fomentarius]
MNRQKQEVAAQRWQPSPDSARDEIVPPLKTWSPEAFYTPSSSSSSYPNTPVPVTLDEAFARPFSLSSSTYTILPDGLPASRQSSLAAKPLMSATSFLSETSRSPSVASDSDKREAQSRESSVEDLSGMRSPTPFRQSWYAV